jgi:flagellar biosynthesis/type III secretory pathway M-ring protein FliF/YscJ
MPAVVLLIIVLLVVFLVLKSVHDARARSAGDESNDDAAPSTRPSRSERRVAARREAREPAPSVPVDENALKAHAAKLRKAVAEGLISAEEATASVVRQSHGHMSEEAARELLDIDDEAA